MPDDFVFPNQETVAWTPSGVIPLQGENGVIRMMIFSAMARLRPGATPDHAAAEATARARSAPDPMQAGLALFGGSGDPVVSAAPARDVLTAEVRPALLVLLAAIGLLFVAATASMIVLQLSRVSSRTREMALRAAIGAGTGRLWRQWLVESSLLGLVGGLSGVLIALVLHRGLPAVLPAGFPRVEDVRLDWRVTVFAVATTMLVSIACGIVPALVRGASSWRRRLPWTARDRRRLRHERPLRACARASWPGRLPSRVCSSSVRPSFCAALRHCSMPIADSIRAEV